MYIGLNDIKQVIACQNQLEFMGLVTEVREAQRIKGFSEEIKIWKPNHKLILALLLRDYLVHGKNIGVEQSIFAKRPRKMANDSSFIDYWTITPKETKHVGSFLEAGTQYQLEKAQSEGRKIINLVPLSGIIMPNQIINAGH
jgi:hypothetical protein